MKNRNMQSKATALLIPLLACFAVFFAATTSARAGAQVPFPGNVSGYVETQEPLADPCVAHVHVINSGNAAQLGAFTGSAEFYPNFCAAYPNIVYTGSFHWFAANGDEISGTFNGYLTFVPATPGVYDNLETATITGGTGRFANATGSFTLGGQIDFTTTPPSFVLPWQGFISSLGSTKKP